MRGMTEDKLSTLADVARQLRVPPHRMSGQFAFEIRNANGKAIMVATEEETARWAAQLLNVAYKHDKL